LETRANVHEIFGKPASNSVVHVLLHELSNEQPLRNSNAAEADSHPFGHLPEVERDPNSVRQRHGEADGSASSQASAPQMHELDISSSFRGESRVGGAYQVSGAISEEPSDSTQETQATYFRPPVAHETLNDLCRPASSQAQVSEVDPQAVPKGGYIVHRPQIHAAELAITPKAIKRKALPLPLSEGTQSSDPATGSSRYSKIDILHTQIDKVREEKERLVRLQELHYQEAELQREIMNEQRKELSAE
jgi:hypothetical protein